MSYKKIKEFFINSSYLIVISLIVCSISISCYAKEDMSKYIDVQIKLVNGESLPMILKDAESTGKQDKYLLVKIINNIPRGLANFNLEIKSSNNSGVNLDLPIEFVSTSVHQRKPFYYLYYIGTPAMFVPEEETKLEWKIKDLYVQ